MATTKPPVVEVESPGAGATPPVPYADITPNAGGSYSRDPLTGVLTLVTPSTTQE
jgi:hypothetical protein